MKDLSTQLPYHIYLIKADATNYKIGFAQDVEKRLKQIQTGNPYQLKILRTQKFETTEDDIKKIERELHKRFLHLQTEAMNEWFILSDAEVAHFLHLLDNPAKIPMTEIETYQLIFNLGQRNNIHYTDDKKRIQYQKKSLRKKSLVTFGEEFWVDSYKQKLNLDILVKDLPPAPSDISGKIVGKSTIWANDFGFIQYVAKDFVWKHYWLRYKMNENTLLKIIPSNQTIAEWLKNNCHQ
jgi:predicted GIY-YIG superfamily endonuclease